MTEYYMLGAHRNLYDDALDERNKVWHRSETAVYYGKDEIVLPKDAVFLTGANQMEYVVSENATMNFKGGFQLDIPNKRGIAIFNAPWSDGGAPVPLSRTVGNRYVPYQNLELADVLDTLATEWPLEGFMVLKDGEIVVFQLKISEYYPGNQKQEKTLSYLTLANDHTNGGLMWLKTHIRTVCWNTYNASLGDSENKIRIVHSKNAETLVRQLAAVEKMTLVQQKEEEEVLNDLFSRKVDKKEVNSFLANVFPEPGKTTVQTINDMTQQANVSELADGFFELADKDSKTTDWKQSRSEKQRLEVAGLYHKFGQEFDYAENTAYALWNAATEFVTHSNSYTGTPEKNYVSQLSGEKAKTLNRAYDEVLELTGRPRKYFKKSK